MYTANVCSRFDGLGGEKIVIHLLYFIYIIILVVAKMVFQFETDYEKEVISIWTLCIPE